jgi:hypothetical protein
MSFTRYSDDDIAHSNQEIVRGLWTGDVAELTSFYSTVSIPGYVLSVYKENPATDDLAKTQFDVQYGHAAGSGSVAINASVPSNTPTRIIYGQYRNLIYGTETTKFKFDNSVFSGNVDDIFVINISRARYKEAIQPGSLKLVLKNGSNVITLTDNSKDVTTTSYIESNKYYTLVSGSAGSNVSNIINPNGAYGFVFPDLGIIVINARALASSVPNGGIGFDAANYGSDRHIQFYNLIVAGASFSLQSVETLSSIFFFTRVKNKEYNYTSNPSFIDDNGNILFTNMIYNPQTYITTVGLYNDQGDLIAIAKLSKPQAKDFTKELNLRIKLDF